MALLVAAGLLGASCALGRETTARGRDLRWRDMSAEQRMSHMSQTVAPAMGELFRGHDAERFADFGCKTCHAEGTFAMPNPGLPHLDASGYYKKHRKASPDMVHFMWKEVEPQMAELLGVTHGEHGYFACRSCHVVEGD